MGIQFFTFVCLVGFCFLAVVVVAVAVAVVVVVGFLWQRWLFTCLF